MSLSDMSPGCLAAVQLLVEDIAALRPTMFAGVPRVFDRIYAGVMAKVGGWAGSCRCPVLWIAPHWAATRLATCKT